MRKFLLNVSVAGALFAADTPYWVKPCTGPATSCQAGDVDLARWAFEAWQEASGGRIHFVRSEESSRALLRLVWAMPSGGLYGDTKQILVNGRRGARERCSHPRHDRLLDLPARVRRSGPGPHVPVRRHHV